MKCVRDFLVNKYDWVYTEPMFYNS